MYWKSTFALVPMRTRNRRSGSHLVPKFEFVDLVDADFCRAIKTALRRSRARMIQPVQCGNGGWGYTSVEAARARQDSRSRCTTASFSAMRCRQSVPRGKRNGGCGAFASSMRA